MESEWPKISEMWSLVLCTPLFVLLHFPANQAKIVFVLKFILMLAIILIIHKTKTA